MVRIPKLERHRRVFDRLTCDVIRDFTNATSRGEKHSRAGDTRNESIVHRLAPLWISCCISKDASTVGTLTGRFPLALALSGSLRRSREAPTCATRKDSTSESQNRRGGQRFVAGSDLSFASSMPRVRASHGNGYHHTVRMDSIISARALSVTRFRRARGYAARHCFGIEDPSPGSVWLERRSA